MVSVLNGLTPEKVSDNTFKSLIITELNPGDCIYIPAEYIVREKTTNVACGFRFVDDRMPSDNVGY